MVNCQIYAIIVAGGKGLRMNSQIRKQYIKILDVPLLSHTIAKFTNFDSINHIVVVVPKEDITYCLENIILPYSFNKKVSLVAGGTERQQSVMNGLKKVNEYDNPQLRDSINEDKNRIVLIHDGVRPFVDHDIINRSIQGALQHGSCIPVVPVVDTLKLMDSNGFVAGVIDRTNLYKIQTPQAFELDLITKAHEDAILSKVFATDDASLVERLGKRVFMTQGSKRNIKITTQEDLFFAEHIYQII